MHMENETKNATKPFIAGFWLIAAIPVVGMVFVPLMNLIHLDSSDEWIGLLLIAAIFFGSAYLWARSLAERSGLDRSKAFNLAGAAAFTVSVWGMRLWFEPLFGLLFRWFGVIKTVEGTHNEFVVIFVFWTGLVCGLSGFALGLARKDIKLALYLLAAGFITGALVFGATIFVMGYFGFWVGTPRPDGLPSMPIITLLGIWSTALAGSEVFGRILHRKSAIEGS